MAFSGTTITQPAVGSEARKIAKALKEGTGITGPAHKELVARLRKLRKFRAKAQPKHGNGVPSKKSI